MKVMGMVLGYLLVIVDLYYMMGYFPMDTGVFVGLNIGVIVIIEILTHRIKFGKRSNKRDKLGLEEKKGFV